MNKPAILDLAISQCPNDTFIFEAIINKKIDTNNLNFNLIFADIEELNKMALNKKPDMIKVSYAIIPQIHNDYYLLNAGGAIGYKCGPLIITSKNNTTISLNEASIAVPGKNTTANLLLTKFYPEAKNKRFMKFNRVEDEVLSGMADAGVIIHESRFTYRKKNLVLHSDLGQMWHKRYNLPLPLGCIAVKKTLKGINFKELNTIVKNSLLHAINDPTATFDFVKKHSQSISSSVINDHIDLYVNNFSIDLSDRGKVAVKKLLEKSIPKNTNLFIDDID